MPTVAYRVTRSRRKFMKSPEIKAYMGRVMDTTVKPKFLGQFENVVASWKNKPKFKARKFLKPDSISLNVFPTGEHKKIWQYVSKGTKRHKIPKSPMPPGKALAFNWGGYHSYKAKTGPRGYYKGPGRVVGGTLHRFKQVDHPGNKAREFERIIRNRNKKWFNRTMENAWRRAIRRA